MLTPRFELSQTDSEIIITIHAPYTNIKETEVYVEGNDFRFYSMPYYLRLKLPGEIVENDLSVGNYDCEKGDFLLRFSKVNKGEHFENLDMITTLLAPPKKKSNLIPNIEVIGNPVVDCEQSLKSNDEQNEEEYDNKFFIEQNIDQSSIPSVLLSAPKYGFGNKVSGALTAFDAPWLREVFDLPSPDSTPMSKRTMLREKHEQTSFNEEHYMADLMQQDSIDPNIMTFEPEWQTWNESNVILTDAEKDILKELPNKEYLLGSNEIQSVLLGVIDILFASCYDERTTLGEYTVESSWTINKLSSTLCWFETFTTIKEVVRACIRRSLCYPLFRNWDLSVKVLEDVKKAVKLGKKYIIKRFCEINTLFNNSLEPRYLLNQLYIRDYLIWLQQTTAGNIEILNNLLTQISPEKKDMGLDLEELEQAAHSVYEENLVIENSVRGITEHLKDVSIHDSMEHLLPNKKSDSDESDTTSSSSSSESSSSSSDSSDSSLDSDDDSEPE